MKKKLKMFIWVCLQPCSNMTIISCHEFSNPKNNKMIAPQIEISWNKIRKLKGQKQWKMLRKENSHFWCWSSLISGTSFFVGYRDARSSVVVVLLTAWLLTALRQLRQRFFRLQFVATQISRRLGDHLCGSQSSRFRRCFPLSVKSPGTK